ncbi:hypothetical protein G7046_g1864 [Stylonectria norvegica]|nr:hypothetical protein G7046_g1864 [Stylonectria norvegica]
MVPESAQPYHQEVLTTEHAELSVLPMDMLEMSDFGAFSDMQFRQMGTSTGDLYELSFDASKASVPVPESCECAQEVSESLRSLRRTLLSHNIVRQIRRAVDLVEKLLICPICYDVSKSTRITIQNVMLIGRLMLEATSAYRRYLRWLKDPCNEQSEMVYLIPGTDISLAFGYEISGEKIRDVIIHGLRDDVRRLENLGGRFALRQHNRHMMGHEACPDAEGRCWREEDDIDRDVLDICPQSCTSKSLAPCHRIVQEVRATIQQLAEAIA